MTVSTAPTPLSYDGNGSTTAFPITWKYNSTTHVVATLRSSAGAETVWVVTTNYTITAAGDTGTLTAVTAPATGQTLVITLEPPNTQASDIPLGGDLPSGTIEDGLDLAAQRDGKIESLFLRALRVPKTDTQTGSLLELPIDSLRASKFLAFNASGAPIAAAGTSANLTPVSAFIDTLLDDVAEVNARQTLLLDKKGADIASAATVNLDTSTGDLVDVTGTVTITAITLAEGVEKTVRFTGILTLTHGASLVLPGSVNIPTAVGDFAVFRGYASGVVRLVVYQTAKALSGTITLGTEQSSASGTAIDFTGIPAGTKRITVMFVGVSTNGVSGLLVQLGDSGGIEATDYLANGCRLTGTPAATFISSTAGFPIVLTDAAILLHGHMTICLEKAATNAWSASYSMAISNGANVLMGAGTKNSLTTELDRVRITTVNGTDVFDAGVINISYDF